MSPVSLFLVVLAYFGLLLVVARRTSRNATNESFFNGNKSSNWLLVAFGMVGTTLSGVTFISVPGAVGRVPIVALTANADPEDAKHYLSIGMAAVVEKPIKPERLRMAMNAAISAAHEDAKEQDQSGRAVA